MWSGRVYSNALGPPLRRATHIYHGVWGMAPFQSLYGPGTDLWGALPLIPEWYLLIAALGVLTALGALWPPLLLASPFLAGAVVASLAQAIRGDRHATFEGPFLGRRERLRRRALTALLYLLQPAARLRGRLQSGLTPWRRRRPAGVDVPRGGDARFWSERWQPPETWVRSIQEALREGGATVLTGGPFDRFDLEVRGGILGAVRVMVAVEEHGGGRQLVRVRYWPRWSAWPLALAVPLAVVSATAAAASAWLPASLFATLAGLLVVRAADDVGAARSEVLQALERRVGSVAVALATPRRAG